MTVLARWTPEGVELCPPQHERATWVDEDTLLLGFPAAPDRTPWSRLDADRQAHLVESVVSGSDRLTGGWALIARRGGTLIVRSDPAATRPLLWRRAGNRVTLADDIWSLLDNDHPLDPAGVADFLIVGYGVGSATIFEEVRVLGVDTVARFDADGDHLTTFDPPASDPEPRSLDEAAQALGTRFDALLAPYDDLERVLVPLSGGLDSRVLAALAVDRGLDVHAWTFALRRGSADERIARRVARTLGVPHTVSIVDPAAMPDRATAWVDRASAQMSLEHIHAFGAHTDVPEGFDVSLSGPLGETVVGDMQFLPAGTQPDDVLTARLRRLVQGRDPDLLDRRLPGVPGWSSRMLGLLQAFYETVGCDPRRSDYVVLRNRPARFTPWAVHAARDRLRWVLPYTDQALWGTTYAMPEQWRRGSVAYRHLVAERWPALGRITWERTGLPPGRRVGSAEALARHVARRIARRHSSFVDPRRLADKFAPQISRAQSRTAPVLSELGVDVAGLLDDHAPDTTHGRALRLRLATIDLARERALEPRKPSETRIEVAG